MVKACKWISMTQNPTIPIDKNSPAPIRTLIIRQPKKWVPVNFRELWEYRELRYSFVSSDVKIQYKQTARGFLWAIGLWLSALIIKYRDFQYTLPFIIPLGLYASPVVYPSSIIPAQYRVFYGPTPMGGVIDGFYWGCYCAACRGFVLFQKREQYFTDVV